VNPTRANPWDGYGCITKDNPEVPVALYLPLDLRGNYGYN